MYKKYEELIKERGLTSADVANATGLYESIFSNWKKRGGMLSVENLHKIAAFLGVSMEYFLKDGEGNDGE